MIKQRCDGMSYVKKPSFYLIFLSLFNTPYQSAISGCWWCPRHAFYGRFTLVLSIVTLALGQRFPWSGLKIGLGIEHAYQIQNRSKMELTIWTIS